MDLASHAARARLDVLHVGGDDLGDLDKVVVDDLWQRRAARIIGSNLARVRVEIDDLGKATVLLEGCFYFWSKRSACVVLSCIRRTEHRLRFGLAGRSRALVLFGGRDA